MTVRIAQGRLGSFLYQDNDVFIGRSLHVYGEASEGELSLLRQTCKAGDWAVVAGANIGTIAVPMAMHVGSQGRLFAFEPQRLTYQLLCGNLALNHIENTLAVQRAVGGVVGMTRVETLSYGRNANYGAIRVGVDDGEPVEMITLDSMSLPRLDVLVADVEGFEEEVLRGGDATICRCRPVLYLENNIREKSPALLGRLFALGYKVWWHLVPMFHPGNGRGVTEDVFGGMITVNILCLPEERAGAINGMRPVGTADDWWRRD
ncbi:MAG TPA: FkbM family methyltransferase [Candidatus Sulfotelmatobacter sp.]|jgi:FkbM family methyltransferase|nr:FkbM family methyltransferase [Candidatus Sulfotelmatobacter sp.]